MRLVGKIFKWVGIAVAVLLAIGCVYGQVAHREDAALAPPRSDMLVVGGHAYYVSCSLGGWSIFWWRVQPLLAQAGRACVFDRAGEGWSDAFPHAHDGLSAADELAAIVRAARIPRPFMYVGHLQGANFAEIYFKAHPSDIAALVLLEPGDPTDLLEDFHGTRAEAMRAPECATMCFVAKILGYSGLTRAMAAATPGRHFPGAMKGQYRAGLGRPSHSENTVAYYGALPKTAYQDRDVKSFGNTAVLLFNSSELRSPEGSETIADVQRWRVRYLAFLRSLAAKSTRGSGLVEVPHSTHATLTLDAADADFIAKAIVSFAAQLGHKS